MSGARHIGFLSPLFSFLFITRQERSLYYPSRQGARCTTLSCGLSRRQNALSHHRKKTRRTVHYRGASMLIKSHETFFFGAHFPLASGPSSWRRLSRTSDPRYWLSRGSDTGEEKGWKRPCEQHPLYFEDPARFESSEDKRREVYFRTRSLYGVTDAND